MMMICSNLVTKHTRILNKRHSKPIGMGIGVSLPRKRNGKYTMWLRTATTSPIVSGVFALMQKCRTRARATRLHTRLNPDAVLRKGSFRLDIRLGGQVPFAVGY